MEHSKRLLIKEGDFLLREGEQSDELFVLISGCLKVYKKLGRNSTEIGTVLPGQTVGEMSFLDKAPRSGDVKAFKESTVGVIEREKFDKFLEELPPWFKKLQETLLKRLREANQKLVI